MLPGQAMEAADEVLGELQTPQGGLMSVGIALAFWAASAGVTGTMNARNVVFRVKPTWKRLVVSVAFMLALALMLIIAVWTWARWPLAVFLLMLVVALVYYAAPNIKQPFRLITPGSVLAVAIWVAASLGFGFHVQNFASYNQPYGSMNAVIVLLFYFLLSAAVLLFGPELNAAIAQESRDSD